MVRRGQRGGLGEDSLTHLPTHQFPHPPTHPPTHSPTHPPTCSLTDSDVVPFFQRAAQGLDGLSERSSLSDVEYMTDIVVQSDRQGRSDAITDYYAASDLAAQNREDLGRLAGVLNDLTPSQREYLAVKRATVTPSWFGLKTLFKYRLRADLKDPLFLLPRVVDKLLIGFILFTLYWWGGLEGVGPSFEGDSRGHSQWSSTGAQDPGLNSFASSRHPRRACGQAWSSPLKRKSSNPHSLTVTLFLSLW